MKNEFMPAEFKGLLENLTEISKKWDQAAEQFGKELIEGYVEREFLGYNYFIKEGYNYETDCIEPQRRYSKEDQQTIISFFHFQFIKWPDEIDKFKFIFYEIIRHYYQKFNISYQDERASPPSLEEEKYSIVEHTKVLITLKQGGVLAEDDTINCIFYIAEHGGETDDLKELLLTYPQKMNLFTKCKRSMPHITDKAKISALDIACYYGHVHICHVLVSLAKARITENTLMIAAARNAEIFQFLFPIYLNIYPGQVKPLNLNALLLLAIENGIAENAKYLIGKGAWMESSLYCDPVLDVIEKNRKNILAILLKLPLNSQCPYLFYRAAASNAWDCAQLLMEYKADINKHPDSGFPPVFEFAKHNNTKAVLGLLDAGAKINCPGKNCPAVQKKELIDHLKDQCTWGRSKIEVIKLYRELNNLTFFQEAGVSMIISEYTVSREDVQAHCTH